MDFILAFAGQRKAVADPYAQLFRQASADHHQILVIILQETPGDDVFSDQADRRFDRGLGCR